MNEVAEISGWTTMRPQVDGSDASLYGRWFEVVYDCRVVQRRVQVSDGE